MKHFVIKNIRIITSKRCIDNGFIEVENGIIKNFGIATQFNNPYLTIYDGNNYKVFPGFIDCHTHGGYGIDFESDNIKDYVYFSKKIAQEGVTSYLQTAITDDFEKMKKRVENFGFFLKEQKNSEYKSFSKCIGIHLEGPFISKIKKGAHNEKYILDLNHNQIEQLQKTSGNNIKIVTYDLEHDNQGIFLNTLKKLNIIGSVGHCNSSIKTFYENGINHGLKHVSHLFNAMSGMENRNCGVAAGALAANQVLCELIVDGVHVDDALIEIALKTKTHKKICLITDSVAAKQQPDGQYVLGDLCISKKENICTLKNSNTLAGSVARFDECFKRMQKITKANDIQMLHMASKNIAEQLNMSSLIGDIDVNMCADLVFLDDNYDVKMTMVDGVIVYYSEK